MSTPERRPALTDAEREAIREQVRSWPPLTADQVRTVARILTPKAAASE